MSDYIKRSDVLEVFSNLQPSGFEHSMAGIVAIKTVKAVPVADVMPVKYGHWIDEHTCSKCGFEAFATIRNIKPHYDYDWNETNFCPNYGVTMDKKV